MREEQKNRSYYLSRKWPKDIHFFDDRKNKEILDTEREKDYKNWKSGRKEEEVEEEEKIRWFQPLSFKEQIQAKWVQVALNEVFSNLFW